MNCILSFFVFLSLVFHSPRLTNPDSYRNGWAQKEKIFVGSTPANSIVRTFLGISLTDSIDFIRWKLVLQDGKYQLQCNYGIGQPNTNGFINGGKRVEWKGSFSKKENAYQLNYSNRKLKLVELNADLLHIINNDRHLLVGNGGWSYTLNCISPASSNLANVTTSPIVIKDSVEFEGRTPCGVPGIIPSGKLCYKLKWYIVFYSNGETHNSGRYRLFGTGWRAQGGLRGNWDVRSDKDDRIIYQLKDEQGKTFIHLLQLDERVLIFTDVNGKLLVGDEDFSYTLNRKN